MVYRRGSFFLPTHTHTHTTKQRSSPIRWLCCMCMPWTTVRFAWPTPVADAVAKRGLALHWRSTEECVGLLGSHDSHEFFNACTAAA